MTDAAYRYSSNHTSREILNMNFSYTCLLRRGAWHRTSWYLRWLGYPRYQRPVILDTGLTSAYEFGYEYADHRDHPKFIKWKY